jgi:hypothetical protein
MTMSDPNIDGNFDETGEPPTCAWCHRLLWAAGGCTTEAVGAAGWPPNTYLYGAEPDLLDVEAESGGGMPSHCGDCGVDRLELHHPGCCVAVCRDCEGQAFGCEHCDGGEA